MAIIFRLFGVSRAVLVWLGSHSLVLAGWAAVLELEVEGEIRVNGIPKIRKKVFELNF